MQLVSLLVLLACAELPEETWHPAAGSILAMNLDHLQETKAQVSGSASSDAAASEGP